MISEITKVQYNMQKKKENTLNLKHKHDLEVTPVCE